MGNPKQIDFGGNTLVVDGIRVGATAPGQSGTELTGSEIALLDGITAGTAAASKAVVVDSNVDIAGLGTVGLARIDRDSGTVTLSSNAGTITKWTGIITTESLTTAHTDAETLVITKTGVATTDFAKATIIGGTNAGGLPVVEKVVCTTNTVTITLRNVAASTNPFDGTFILALEIDKK